MKRLLFSCLLATVCVLTISAQIDGQQPQGGRPRGDAPGRPPQGGRPGGPGGQGRPGGMGRPGGLGSRNTNITYAGATELTAGATETGKTYQSEKTDENALAT